jgi:IS605 OrfB family transposase
LKATLRLKLNTDEATLALLQETSRQSTACFNAVCRYGFEHNERNGVRLHQSTYTDLRKHFDALPSQLVVSARMKATEALKSVEELRTKKKKVSCPQSQLCPIRYDVRSYWVRLSDGVASLASVCGRVGVTFHLPECYRQYLTWRTCSADLCWDSRKKHFYLHVVMDKDAENPMPTGKVIGCDMGVRRVAVTCTPQFFSSARMHTRVRQYQHLKSSLQAKGTKSATRHLRKVSRRWTRFQANSNHLIANAILAPMAAGDTLAIEDLTDIRDGCKHRKKQRGLFHGWSFAQLGAFLSYKAERKGVLVLSVDPRYSSQTCSRCQHCERANRKSQSLFCCKSCGYTVNADYNAASNLGQRGKSSLARLLSASPSSPTAVSSPLAQAPRKATYEGSRAETQRVTSPVRLRRGH